MASVVCQVARCYGLGVKRTHQVRSAARVAQSPSHRCRMEMICPLTMGHVWRVPAVQEESDLSAKRSGAAMYAAVFSEACPVAMQPLWLLALM